MRPGEGAANPPPPRTCLGWPGSTYLVRSAPGWRPKPDGDSEGTAGPSRGCSGRGDGRGAASSAGGAGGCMVGGAQDAFLPAEEPLRATQDVSMTLTPMLARDTKTPAYPRVPRSRRPPPHSGHIQARPPGEQQHSLSTLLGRGSEAGLGRCPARGCPEPRCTPAAPARLAAPLPPSAKASWPQDLRVESKLAPEQNAAFLGLIPSPKWEMEMGRAGVEGERQGQHRTRRWH